MRLSIMLAAASLSLMLAACGESTPSQGDATGTQQPAEPVEQLGLVLTNGAVRLPAVAGRPGAAYFTLQSLRDEPVRIVGVSVTGVDEAELHETKVEDGVSMMAAAETIAMEPRETVQFAPGGFHVMLFDVDATLAPGGTTDLTLTLENGDKISTTAQIVGPADELPGVMGEMHSGMEGMEHQSMDGGMAH